MVMLLSSVRGSFSMQKRIIVPATILMALGLTACGNNDEATNGDNTSPLPMGYYSNEHHEESGGNTDWINEDNDGPATELMDHTLGGEGEESTIRGVNNETAPDGKYRDTLFSRNDRNYHGHLNNLNGGARSAYYTNYNGELAKKIGATAASVVNVADVRALIHGEQVLVAAVLEDQGRVNETKASIEDAVSPQLKGKSLTITTDDSTYSRIRTIDNDLREGGPKDMINEEIDNIFKSINNNR